MAVFTGTSGKQPSVVVDCQDAGQHRPAHVGSGRPVPGSRGARHAKLSASLTFTGGHWLIDNITFVGTTC